jgi:hypothetical protein
LGASAQDTKYPPDGQQIPGPPSKEAAAEWQAVMPVIATTIRRDLEIGV